MSATATQITEKPKRKPRFDGVPGQLVTDEMLDRISFGGSKGKISPYDGLLQSLVEQTRTAIGNGTRLPALRFDDVRAITTLKNRAKKKNLKLEFAQFENALYVRINPRDLPASTDPAGKAQNALDAGVLGALTLGPLNKFQIAKKLRESGHPEADAPLCELVLIRLARAGQLIRREDGTYLLKP